MAENAESHESPGLSGRRRTLIWVLIVGASVIGLASILTTWVHRQMLDNEAWSQATAELVQDPQVRDALSVYLVNELYDNVDVAGALAEELPPALKPLAATAAGALREPATNAVNRLLDAPRMQALVIGASSLAQEKLVNVLENETGHGLSTGDGAVTLDLHELVTELGTQLGVPAPALDRVPPDIGVITLMESDQLATAQTAVQSLRILSTFLLILVFGLYGLAIYLAHGARRETLRNVGVAMVLVGLIVLVVRRVGGNYAIDALTVPTSRDAGQRVWLIGTSILGDIGWAAILYGAIAAAGALLAGPTGAATSVRGRIAPVLNDRPGVAWGIVAFAFLLLVLWGGTHALRTWWGIVILGSFLAAGVVALRAHTLREASERPAALV